MANSVAGTSPIWTASRYAEAGDFDQAIQWQQASYELTPADSKRDSVIVLRHFESKRPYTDFGMPVAAGLPRREKPSEALDPKEFLFSDRISMRVVCDLLRSTYFDIEEDDGERLWIDDRIRVSVRLSDDRDQLAFLAIASANENADTEATLRFVNRVNSDLRALRAALSQNGLIMVVMLSSISGVIVQQRRERSTPTNSKSQDIPSAASCAA